MPRLRRRGREREPMGGSDAGDTHPFLSAWGLQPAQWRPVGSLVRVRQRASLLWRDDSADEPDLLLRVRRAYDRLGELGVTVAADTTPRGVEIAVPLGRVSVALRILAERSILPDAVVVGDPEPEQLRRLRRELAACRPSVELITRADGVPDPLDELRARVRAL